MVKKRLYLPLILILISLPILADCARQAAPEPEKKEVIIGILDDFAGPLASICTEQTAGRQDAINNTMGKDMVLLSFAGAILGGASLTGGRGTPIGMLGGALLLGTISNSLTLIGINVFLLYAVYGVIIFLAVVVDRIKVKLREFLFYRENLRKLRTSDAAAGKELDSHV